jgi:excisionase family DNA binding protein
MSDQNPRNEKDVLTTGDVARICNVASRTVSKWFDSGQLKGYRIPGSKDRRIPMSNLLQFMKEHQIPMDGLMSGNPRYEVKVAGTAFEAGLECERFRPHVMLLDLHLDGGNAEVVLGMVRSNEDLQMTRVIGLSARLTEGQAMQYSTRGFDGVLRKPFTVRQVIEWVERSYSIAG